MASEEPSQILEPRFIEILNKVVSSLPQDDTVISSVRTRLETIWNKPRLEDISNILNDGTRLNIGDVRELMFFPTSQHATQYCELIKPPPLDTQSDHPQIKVQIEFLTILYLHHIPHGNWSTFIEPFILAGGLDSLSMSFTHPNLYLRGQAVDAFLQISASRSFDWWTPVAIRPSNKMVKDKVDKRIALHTKMLELSKSQYFIPGLEANADGSKSWPGGPTQCLQLLAFWLSWCRTLYTMNQSMQLSRSLLATIQEWGDHKSVSIHHKNHNASEVSSSSAIDDQNEYEDIDVSLSIPPELIEFRCRMYEDFSRESPIEGPEKVNGVRTMMVKGLIFPNSETFVKTLEPVIELDEGSGAFDISGDAPLPPPPSTSSASTSFTPTRDFSSVVSNSLEGKLPVTSAREKGNTAFASGHLLEALEAYDEALMALQKTQAEGRDLAVIQCNRATVYLALSKQENVHEEAQHKYISNAVEACQMSVKSDSTYAKSRYRLAQCLDASGELRGALSILNKSPILSQEAKKKREQRKNSRGTKSELIEVTATEKLLVQLMEKLALELKERDSTEGSSAMGNNTTTNTNFLENQKNKNNQTTTVNIEEEEEKSDKTNVGRKEDRALEMEASILMQILRRKDAKTRHDYLAERSNAPEGKDATKNDNGDGNNGDIDDAKEGESNIGDKTENEQTEEEVIEKENEEDDDSSVALVVSRNQKVPLSDRQVSLMAEEDSEKLTRNMLELSQGEDSDDDDVILRMKQQKEEMTKMTSKKKKKSSKETDGIKNVDGQVTDSTEKRKDKSMITSSSMNELLCGEEVKGMKVLKKVTQSSSKSTSKEKVTGKQKKEKKEKKSQMDELRRIANSAPSNSDFL